MSKEQAQQVKSQGGEGDREADRRYREKTQDFVEQHGEDALVNERAAEPGESGALERAEAEAEQRAREKDPNVPRDYDKPAE